MLTIDQAAKSLQQATAFEGTEEEGTIEGLDVVAHQHVVTGLLEECTQLLQSSLQGQGMETSVVFANELVTLCTNPTPPFYWACCRNFRHDKNVEIPVVSYSSNLRYVRSTFCKWEKSTLIRPNGLTAYACV